MGTEPPLSIEGQSVDSRCSKVICEAWRKKCNLRVQSGLRYNLGVPCTDNYA